MERITYHGENIGALEQALQTLDPDSYKEYFRTKPTYDSKVLPFKELNAEGGRVGFRTAGYVGAAYGGGSKKSTPSSSSFDRPTMADVSGPSQRPASIGPKPPMQTIDIGDAPKIFDIDETGDPALNPGSDNVTGGIDYTPSFEVPFLEGVLNKGKDFVTTAYNNPLVRLGLGVFLPTEFQRLKQLMALKNVYDRFQDVKEGDFEAYEDLELPDPSKKEIERVLKEGGINRTKKSYKDILKEFELPAFSDGGRVNLQAGSYEPFSEQDLDINPNQTVQVPSRIQTEFDDKTSEAFRIGNFVKSQNLEPSQFGLVQAYAQEPEMFRGFNNNFFSLSRAQGVAPEPFEKQGYSSDIRHGLGTSAGKDAIIDFIGSNTPLSKTGGITDLIGTVGANMASLFEEGKDIFSSAKDYAEIYPGLTGIQDYDFMPDNKYLTQPLEDIAANYVGSKIPFGMSTPQKIAFISNYAKYGNQTLDQIKNLELRKVQNRIKAAEQEKIAEDARKKKIEQQLKTASEAGGGYQPTTTSQNVARTSSRVSPGGNVRAYGLAKGGIVGLYI
jgi:hypothetical protein